MTEQELYSKHAELMWYARSKAPDDPFWLTCDPDIMKGALASQMKVEGKYPKETAELADPESGDWHHGFNSGVMAAIRFLDALKEDGEESATMMFPDLYT